MRKLLPLLLLIAGCTTSPVALQIPTDTYFTYTKEEVAALPPRQEGTEPATVAQLIAWDVRLMDIIRTLRLPPTVAGRFYATVAVAQHDALLLGAGTRGVDAASAIAACDTLPASCERLRPMVQKSPHELALGNLVGMKVIERNKQDLAQRKPPETPAPRPGLWTDVSATTPDAGSWLPFAKDSIVAFPPPPAYGSSEDLENVRAVRDAVRDVTPEQRERIEHWSGSLATESPAGLWLTVAHEQIIKHGISDPLEASRIRMTLSAAMADAFIDCWKTKFTYWTARPSKRDTGIGPILPVPLFPSYPSGHSTVSGAAATVLSAVFPDAKTELWRLANEAANSRLWAGIHFPNDNVQGLITGEKIGQKVLEDERFALYP